MIKMINPVPRKDSQVVIPLVSYGGFRMNEEIMCNGCSLHTLFIHRAALEKVLSPTWLEIVKKKKKTQDSPELQLLWLCEFFSLKWKFVNAKVRKQINNKNP